MRSFRAMGFREWIKPRLQDLVMRQMNPLRAETAELADGDVLEVGFGTALNLQYYGPGVKSLVGLDPMDVADVDAVQARIANVARGRRAALRLGAIRLRRDDLDAVFDS
jgi:hypothetical protein